MKACPNDLRRKIVSAYERDTPRVEAARSTYLEVTAGHALARFTFVVKMPVKDRDVLEGVQGAHARGVRGGARDRH
jgi:hypothetical protein